MAGKTASSQKLGSHIVIVGLVLQVLSFGLFIVVAVVFNTRLHRSPTEASVASGVKWRMHLFALYAISCLIFIRSIFRIVEYVQGSDGYLLHHEIYSYVFDAFLMFAAMLIFNAVHPGSLNRSHVPVLPLQQFKNAEIHEDTSKYRQLSSRHGS
jgi:hypothetical protein